MAPPGYRHRDTGALRDICNEGTVWSASAVDGSTYARRLVLSTQSLSTSSSNSRAFSFLLRCLSE